MPVKQQNKHQTKTPRGTAANDVPQFFRLNVEVGDLESAISFYSKLLGIEGRKQAGSRCYFECAPWRCKCSTSRPRDSPILQQRHFTSR